MACLILSVGTPFVPSRRYLLRTTIRMAFFTPFLSSVFFESTDTHRPSLCPSSVIKARIDELDGFSFWYFPYWWLTNEIRSIKDGDHRA